MTQAAQAAHAAAPPPAACTAAAWPGKPAQYSARMPRVQPTSGGTLQYQRQLNGCDAQYACTRCVPARGQGQEGPTHTLRQNRPMTRGSWPCTGHPLWPHQSPCPHARLRASPVSEAAAGHQVCAAGPQEGQDARQACRRHKVLRHRHTVLRGRTQRTVHKCTAQRSALTHMCVCGRGPGRGGEALMCRTGCLWGVVASTALATIAHRCVLAGWLAGGWCLAEQEAAGAC